ncbi:RHS repeat domain-containing protein [Blastococcus sp. TBT05-19]|uniref:RHS repeat domain-containing protein n=1 Tax=Blastococcus sp. TBT05-19 TaxID=2250581 RepID=UPI001313E69A|nr:RHS repeat-associated core domain-containing protein [Blastococcus sp. TBT05-19]
MGTGNLMVQMNLFSLERRTAGALDVGVVYNSVTRRSEAHFLNSVGSSSSGWRLSAARDVRLASVPGAGAVVYHGPGGQTGTFTADGAGGYDSPAGFKMTLATVAGGGWTLTDHGSGDVSHFRGDGLLAKMTDRSNNATTFAYNTGGGLTEIRTDRGGPAASTLTVTLGGATPRQIHKLSQTATVADPLTGLPRQETHEVTLGYAASNALASVTDAAGRVTEFAYSGGGNLNRVTAPGGAQTSFTYDTHGRVLTVTQPTATNAAGAVTRVNYGTGTDTSVGTVTLVADPNSDQSTAVSAAAHTRYELTDDGMQLVARAVDPAGKERSATYNNGLDLTSSSNSSGTTTFGYNANDGESLTGITGASGAGASYAYGNTGTKAQYQPSGCTDAQNRTSEYTYNQNGQRTATADFSSAEASVAYNGDGTVDTSTSPSGAVTDYSYDTAGQTTGINPPDGSTLADRSYTWDEFGRLASRTSGRGVTDTYTYDALDRVTEIDFSDNTPDVTYTYDDAGQVDIRTDGSGVTTYDYDPLGRLAARTHTAGGGTLRYTYDKAGNLATATNAAGTTRYSYDVRNLVTSMTTAAGRKIDFAHDDDGRRTDAWFEPTAAYDGTVAGFAAHTHNDYDADGRLTRTWTARAGNDGDRVADLSYDYISPGAGACTTAPPAGLVTSLRWAQTDHRTGATTSYCYDRANRLTAATTPGGDDWRYSYDKNGNRTQTTKNGAVVHGVTVNAADQITSSGYSHDGAGDLTTTPANGAMGYSGAEQMTTRTGTGGTTFTYTYAGTDQTELISQSGGHSYAYGRTNANGMPVLETQTSGGTTVSYAYDPQGTPLVMEGGLSHYLAADGLGSPVALINHTGTQTAAYTYDPYGQTTATALNGSGAIDVQRYGYAGGLRDTSGHLMHYGMRWYDPITGRFTQTDSLETLLDPSRSNRYEYANGNPVNYVDPTGKISLLEGVTFALGVVSLATGIGAAAAAAGFATYALTTVSIGTGITSTVFGGACLFNRSELNEEVC